MKLVLNSDFVLESFAERMRTEVTYQQRQACKLLSYQYSKPQLTDRQREEAWHGMSGQQINV